MCMYSEYYNYSVYFNQEQVSSSPTQCLDDVLSFCDDKIVQNGIGGETETSCNAIVELRPQNHVGGFGTNTHLVPKKKHTVWLKGHEEFMSPKTYRF